MLRWLESGNPRFSDFCTTFLSSCPYSTKPQTPSTRLPRLVVFIAFDRERHTNLSINKIKHPNHDKMMIASSSSSSSSSSTSSSSSSSSSSSTSVSFSEHDDDATTSRKRPRLSFPVFSSATERESFLKQWTKEKCANNEPLDVQEGWDVLYSYGIQVLHRFLSGDDEQKEENKSIGSKSFSYLYTISFKLTAPVGEPTSRLIYDNCKLSVENYLISTTRSKLQEILVAERDKFHVPFLEAFAAGWNSTKVLIRWMTKLFGHLDKNVVAMDRLPTVTSCYLQSYFVLIYQPMYESVRAMFFKAIEAERDDESCVSLEVMKDIGEMFAVMSLVDSSVGTSIVSIESAVSQCRDPWCQHLQLYQTHLEAPFFEWTEQYYKTKGVRFFYSWSHTDGILNDVVSNWNEQYAKLVTKLYDMEQAERQRIQCYFHSSSTTQALRIFLIQMVVCNPAAVNDVINSLLQSDCVDHCRLDLTNERKTLLFQFHELLSRTYHLEVGNIAFNFLDPFAKQYRKYVEELGDRIITGHIYRIDPTVNRSDNNSSSSSSSNGDAVVIDATTEFIERMVQLYDHAMQIRNNAFVPLLPDSCLQLTYSSAFGSTYLDGVDRFFLPALKDAFCVVTNKDLLRSKHSSNDSLVMINSRSVGTSSSSSSLSLPMEVDESQIEAKLSHDIITLSPSDTQVGLLASYCEGLLKRVQTKGDLDHMQLLSTLTSCAHLFSHMSDKDLFMELYRDGLAKRLLTRKLSNGTLSNGNVFVGGSENDRDFIGLLKGHCGPMYTAKVEGMLSDFGYSSSLNQNFELYLNPPPPASSSSSTLVPSSSSSSSSSTLVPSSSSSSSSSTLVPSDSSDSTQHPVLSPLPSGSSDGGDVITAIVTAYSPRPPMDVALSVQVLSTGDCHE